MILPFEKTLRAHGLDLHRRPLEVLQVNLGRLCNQACLHCHVEAGPRRPERLERPTADRILALLEGAPDVATVDLTGGAPEMNPSFRHLVQGARALGRTVLDRCNLTVLELEGQEGTAEFLAAHGVRVIASLPYYSRQDVDRQRGRGVFAGSIRGLQRLNALGYGRSGTGLQLDLVHNPAGPFLPPPQDRLEAEYRVRLREDFGIEFHRLFTLTNMPIRRFLQDLERQGRLAEYQGLLVQAFNPAAAEGVMCRTLLSVDWEGRFHDCDFNGMLDLPVRGGHRTIWDVESLAELADAPITFGNHCYGCTAGAGSSCSGALV